MYTQKQMLLREEVLKVVKTDKNKINNHANKQEWYESKGNSYIYDLILELTSFLNQGSTTVRERLYYIENTIGELQVCPYCNVAKLPFRGLAGLAQSCRNRECVNLRKAQTLRNTWETFTEDKKNRIKNVLSQKAKGRRVSETTRQKQRDGQLGRRQSEIVVQKRVNSRKNNGKPWHSEESRRKIAESNSKTHSSAEFQSRVRGVKVLAAKKASETLKSKIQKGLFTPCITNSWTRWKAYVNLPTGELKHFRSSWEALFYLHNPALEYETVRVPYFFENTQKNYIVDFVDRKAKILYEIKPVATLTTPKNEEKVKAAKIWCNQNNYTYRVITEEWYRQNRDLIPLTNNEHLLNQLQKIVR